MLGSVYPRVASGTVTVLTNTSARLIEYPRSLINTKARLARLSHRSSLINARGHKGSYSHRVSQIFFTVSNRVLPHHFPLQISQLKSRARGMFEDGRRCSLSCHAIHLPRAKQHVFIICCILLVPSARATCARSASGTRRCNRASRGSTRARARVHIILFCYLSRLRAHQRRLCAACIC